MELRAPGWGAISLVNWSCQPQGVQFHAWNEIVGPRGVRFSWNEIDGPAGVQFHFRKWSCEPQVGYNCLPEMKLRAPRGYDFMFEMKLWRPWWVQFHFKHEIASPRGSPFHICNEIVRHVVTFFVDMKICCRLLGVNMFASFSAVGPLHAFFMVCICKLTYFMNIFNTYA